MNSLMNEVKILGGSIIYRFNYLEDFYFIGLKYIEIKKKLGIENKVSEYYGEILMMKGNKLI